MGIQQIRFELTGTTPLLLQSERTANPLEPVVKEIRKYTSKKAKDKTDADHAAVFRLEFEGAFYDGTAFDELGPYLPATNIQACVRDAAKHQRKGATVVRSLHVVEEAVKIEYEGPRTIEALWNEQRFVDIRGVRVGRAKVMRCRPIFEEWRAAVTLMYESEMLNRESLIDIVTYAGKYVGLGNFRPTYGRFDANVIKK